MEERVERASHAPPVLGVSLSNRSGDNVAPVLSYKLHHEAPIRAIDPDTANLTGICLNPGGRVVLGSRKSNTIGGASIVLIVSHMIFASEWPRTRPRIAKAINAFIEI